MFFCPPSQADYCQLHFAFGAEHPWAKILFAGGADAIHAALNFLQNYTAWKTRQTTIPVEIYTLVPLEQADVPANQWQASVRAEQHPELLLATGPAPRGQHVRITVKGAMPTESCCTLILSGNTYHLRDQLDELNLHGGYNDKNSYERTTQNLNLADSRDMDTIRKIKDILQPVFYLTFFHSDVSAPVRQILEPFLVSTF